MKVVSLFSGAGGLDLGFILSGHRVVWANDNFKDAVLSYRRNIGDHIEENDIHNISSSSIPNCDIVIGGFPCQGFSVANWARNTKDERNSLYKEMVRVVRDKRPAFFLCENVKGIASLDGGMALQRIIKDFESLDYEVDWKILNAADYGVPQNRLRFIMVGKRQGVRKEVTFPPRPTHTDPQKISQNGLHPWISIGAALSHVPEPEEAPWLPNHTYSSYKLRFNGYLGHRWIDPMKPAPTITARGDERGGVVVIHHPNNRRRVSAHELALVQSFPAEFEFVGSRSSVYRQIANAVAPLFARALGKMFPA